MLKYRLKKIPKKKIIVWSTMILIFVISLSSIVGFYAVPNAFPGLNGHYVNANSDTVIINDLAADWNYYTALNYTEISSKAILPGTSPDMKTSVSSNKYSQSTLVAVQINYSGLGINDVDETDDTKKGFISSATAEQQSKLTYYKYVPVVNNKVKIELIDNPYAKRPTGKAFNGWVCDDNAATSSVGCENLTFSYDDDYYLRYVTVPAPAADSSGDRKLIINLKTSWIAADLKTEINDIDNFLSKKMDPIKGDPIYTYEDIYEVIYDFKDGVKYYTYTSVANGSSVARCDNTIPFKDNQNRCNRREGNRSVPCDCYIEVNANEEYDEDNVYYIVDGEENVWVQGENYWNGYWATIETYDEITEDDLESIQTDNVIDQEQILVGYEYTFENNDLLTGYYYRVDNYNNTNKELYYNANGISCNDTNCGSTAYKLIQYSDADSIKRWSTTTEADGTVIVNTDYSRYYYLVTRDTNILDLPNGTYSLSNFDNKSYPFTITGSHDGGQATVTLNYNGIDSFSVGEDLVIENLTIDGPALSNTDSADAGTSINANYQNVKIGRTIKRNGTDMIATSVIGGDGSDYHGIVAIEAGAYRSIRALNGTNSTGQNIIMQMGNDYDRASGVNDNLIVTYQAVSSISGSYLSPNILPASEMIVKSGKIGSRMLDEADDTSANGRPSSYYMYGIYVGAHSNGNSNAFRTLKVEGGEIFSVNGGPCVQSNYKGNVIGIYVTGGTVQNIVGGAGVTQTDGNRIVSVSGGTVVNAIAGGSNSYAGSSNSNPGPMRGKTLVYVGGNAVVGGTLEYSDGSISRSRALYAVSETGSVFGAGLGQSGSSTRGVVGNSHVIINGATINGSVYGGGNHGATGTNDSSKWNYSLMNIYDGTVYGSVYGGSNSNGAGSSSTSTSLVPKYDYYLATTLTSGKTANSGIYPNGQEFSGRTTCNSSWPGYSNGSCQYFSLAANYNSSAAYFLFDPSINGFVQVNFERAAINHVITMNMYGGTVYNSVYGGSNNTGTVYGDVDINLYKGIVNSTTNSAVFGGGKGDPTIVRKNITIDTNTDNNDDLLVNEIYGGSELGTVANSGNVNVNIDGGTINNVYGGGKGDASISPINSGDIVVNMKSGEVGNIFGGNNIRGVISTDMDVNVSGGTVNNVYGGSDGSLLNVSNPDGIVGATDTNVDITGGTIKTAVYGGGKKAPTSGHAKVNVSGGTFATLDDNGYLLEGTVAAEVFGGGEAAKVSRTTVNILDGAQVYNVYAGSNVSGTVNNATLNNSGGEVLCNSYGGGKIAEVINANSYLFGTDYTYQLKENETAYTTTCGNAFGGGANADVTHSNITLYGSSMLNVYGGSNEGGTVTESNVFIRKGNVENAFGGNNAGGSTTNSLVDVNNKVLFDLDINNDGNKDYNIDINGDGTSDLNVGTSRDYVDIDLNNDKTADATGSTEFTVTNVFGGSNGLGASIGETTTTNIYGGTVSGDVFGGGNQAKVVEATYVNMYDGTVRNLYGGGNRSFVGDAIVNDLGVLTGGNEYGLGATYVNVVGGTITSNVYGSSNASFVYGSTYIKIGDTALEELNINDNVTRDINIGSVFAGSETNVDKSTTYDDNYEGVTALPNKGTATGLVEIDGTSYVENDVSTLVIKGSIYGSGNNSKVRDGSNIYIDNYGTKVNPARSISIQRAKNVYITDSHLELDGTIDRADPNSYKYSLIRLDALYLLGTNADKGTYIYLKNGSTFLKSLYSGKMANGIFTPQKVTDNNGVLNVSVTDNRLYMLEGKTLSVSDSKAPSYDTTTTPAGPITGMTFLGMFIHEEGKPIKRGIYDYTYGDGSVYSEANSGVVGENSYTFVYGLNLTDYTMKEQIVTHGFYTNVVEGEEDEVLGGDNVNDSTEEDTSDDGKTLKLQYVGVTPSNETTLYYKWLIGVEPVEIIVDLVADKYSESGAVNALITKEELKEVITNAQGEQVQQDWRDAIMTILAVNTTRFGATAADATRPFDGVLVDKSDIPTINTDDKNGDGVIDANNYFALSMGTTSSGWLDNYKTNFYDEDYIINEDSFCNTANGNCTGDQIYLYDSTANQRNLSFWLYHSKNLDFSYIIKDNMADNMLISMNQVIINTEFRNPHGDPTSASSVQPVTIVVNISLSDGELDKYGGVIAPGKQYEMFQGRPTTIASNGSFSIYQSLSLDLTKTIAGSATGEKWDVGKLYHKAKTVEVTDAYGQTREVEWSKSYRYLTSSYLLPVGTVVSMLDLKNNEQYYYEVTADNYASKATEFSGKNEYKYYLEDFVRMGSTTDTNLFDDDMNEELSKKYYYHDDNTQLAVEEFIFSVDFAGANVDVQNASGDEHYFFLQLARKEFNEEKVIVSTNGSPRDEMIYTLMPQVSSAINTTGGYVQDDGTVTEETTIYVGDSTQLELETSLIQVDENNNVLTGVSDTVFDEYKLGAKITIKRAQVDENGNIRYDENGNILYEDLTNDLFGTVMEINGQTYYPQTDGSTRIELAGRITDVISKIDIDFSNSSLTYGDYVLVVETFVSYDGLYYGDFEPTYNEFPFELLNNQYGLDVKTETSTQVTHDVNTGEDATGSREIHYVVDVINGLSNPKLKVSLERRDYSSTYGTSYQAIPVTNLVEEIRFGDSETNIISSANSCFKEIDGACYIYSLSDITNSSIHNTYDVYFTLKNGPSANDLGTNKPNAQWKSGTYRVVYSLYDGDVEVGSVYEYLIIRSLGVDEIVIEGSGN